MSEILLNQLLWGWNPGWINQPSKLQRWNYLHGKRIYYKVSPLVKDNQKYYEIVYVDDYDVMWPKLIPRSAVANGDKG